MIKIRSTCIPKTFKNVSDLLHLIKFLLSKGSSSFALKTIDMQRNLYIQHRTCQKQSCDLKKMATKHVYGLCIKFYTIHFKGIYLRYQIDKITLDLNQKTTPTRTFRSRVLLEVLFHLFSQNHSSRDQRFRFFLKGSLCGLYQWT